MTSTMSWSAEAGPSSWHDDHHEPAEDDDVPITASALPPFLKLANETASPHSSQIFPPASSANDPSSALKNGHKPSKSTLLVPPLMFSNVARGICRSGHPNERNYEFLRRLGLKTIMYLANEDYRASISTFAEQQGIKVLHHRITVNKEPFAEMEEDAVAEALSQALDRRNHPILIHCNKGKYRVGVLVGILRRLQGWSHTTIFEEYARFAGTKALDEEFIEVFDLSKVKLDPEHSLKTLL